MTDPNALPLDELYAWLRSTGLVRRVLELARDEDLGPRGIAGDATSVACGAARGTIVADVVAREACTIAGLAAVPEMIDVFGGGIAWQRRVRDGDAVERGTVVATLEGPAHAVLALERTVLNLVSRLSGIATHARAMRAAMDAGAPGHRAVVLDTRKTTPGLRVLEKYAVRCGGCHCHRIGLFDAVLVKDNHLAGVGLDALAAFVRGVSERGRAIPGVRFVEVEVDTVAQLERVLTLEPGVVDIVLLDNMGVAGLREAVAMRDGSGSRVLLEASGGVTMDRIAAIAATGVDRISVGSLTHGARVVDLGLDARNP
jgi:nicotinate-nucleotide pyrophosphorylase (carboxylating)